MLSTHCIGEEELTGVKSALQCLLYITSDCGLSYVDWNRLTLEEGFAVNIFFSRQDLESFYKVTPNSASLQCKN